MLKPAASLGLIALVLGLSVWGISQDREAAPVEMAVLNEQNWDRFVPDGKEVDAIYGDIVLRNKYVTAVIAQPLASRNANMTVRTVGGCLLDFTARQQQSDQLSCFYPGQRVFPYSEWTITTPTEADVAITSTLERHGGAGAVTVTSHGSETRPTVKTTYSLAADSRILTVSSKFTHTTGSPIIVNLHDDMRIDGGKEDIVKAPNGTTDWYWVEDRYWQQAYGFRATGLRVQSNSDARRSALTYLANGDRDMVTLKAGESFELVRELACGANRMAAKAAFDVTDGKPVVSVHLTALDAAQRPVAEAQLNVKHEGSTIGVARTDDRGNVTLPLPPGDYELQATVNGQVIIKSSTLIVTGSGEQRHSLVASDYHPGTLRVAVVDKANGQGLPAKIEIIGQDGVPTPDFAPETAEFAVKNLRYAPHGEFTQDLQPGTYQLIVSHGPEYSAVFTNVEVKPGETTNFNTSLVRQVDTTGWISSDFHSHSSPSGDNTGSQLGRVLNLVCEHIEFAPCTEHNRITTYQPHIDELKISPFLSSVTGMELTGSPLPLNHQNAFPLHHHPHRQDGGGPQTDTDIERQMQRLAAWDNGSDKLIQQNHPDVGWLFYDRDGNGDPDGGYSESVALIDVMEIHPVDRILESSEADGVDTDEAKKNRIFKWLQLLNQGYRIPGVVNTDAHYNFHGSGWLRNWIACSTDDPAKIDPMEIVHASEEGRVIMSNGPFLRVQAQSGNGPQVTAGQDLRANGGKLQLEISVQCPDWHDIDIVFVLINGRSSPEHVFTRSTHPQLFPAEGAVRFATKLNLQLPTDAHLVVATGGTESTLGPVMGPSSGKTRPAALANPIFVDIDGNGFTPNKDTLGLPLPVKGD